MNVSRRELIGLGALSALAAGCAKVANGIQGDDLPANIDLPKGDIHPTVRLLNRAGFGPKPGQVAEVEALGHERWIDRQLSPTDDEPLALSLQLGNLEALYIDSEELRDEDEDDVLTQLQAATLLRAIDSPWQIRERMVDFWSNHFNIYGRKGLGAWRKPTDDAQVVRRHALGTFPALLNASAHSPAMLAYLDNQVNTAGVANENYARELMELHTLGLHGGYSQRDVMEVARCFTGWTVERRFGHRIGAFRFDASVHDDGAKVVLGRRIPPGLGERDAQIVLDILAKHPATARFIAGKLCTHFLGATETPWHKRLAEIYLQTDGDIPAMLKPLLLSPEVREGPPVAKRPIDFLVSALRAFDAETDGGPGLQRHLEHMGQPLFQWPMPDGYPDRTSAWTGSLLARWNFAAALVEGRIGGTSIDFDRLKSKMDRYSVQSLALETSPKASSAALALCAPEFQWR